MKLFGTDGVRGRAGKVLTAQIALNLAMAAGIYFRKHSRTNKILVGKDTRRSGYMIENALVAGLTAVGYDVIQIGPMPTPAIAFLTEDMRCDAGIMISASHNPFEDNGIKFFGPGGDKLSVEAEEEIERLYEEIDTIAQNQKVGREVGSSKRIDDVIGRYIVAIKNSFPKALTLHGMRIVIDTANGAAYKVAPTILGELGADLIVLHDKPDGFNINEGCGALHPTDLAQAVRTYRADIGFAFDGDADRLVVVDEKGEIVEGDHLLAALAGHLQATGMLKGGKIAATVMSNGAMERYLASKNIGLIRTDVGDKYILEALQRDGLNFGGEQSGHIVFSDYAKTGDGLVSALQTAALVLGSKAPASKVLRPFKPDPQVQKALIVKHKPPLESIAGLAEKLAELEAAGIRHLIRYSGTESKLRLLLEGPKEALIAQKLEEMETFLSRAVNG